MNVRPVENLSQLVAGQFYIRVYVNHKGEVGFGTLKVCGRPYHADKYGRENRLLSVDMLPKANHDRSRWNRYFVTDLGAVHHRPRGEWSKALFPFSNSTLNKIKAASSNPFKMLELIRGRQLTAEEKRELGLDWKEGQQFDKQWDAAFDKAYYKTDELEFA